jgi:hypothetical protein
MKNTNLMTIYSQFFFPEGESGRRPDEGPGVAVERLKAEGVSI